MRWFSSDVLRVYSPSHRAEKKSLTWKRNISTPSPEQIHTEGSRNILLFIKNHSHRLLFFLIKRVRVSVKNGFWE